MNKTLSKAVLTIVFSLTTLSANAQYTFSLLDGLGGNLSEVRGINNSGQIVGWSNDRATLWNGGVATDLGTIGGLYSYASAINDSEQIVGMSTNTSGYGHATLWNGGMATDLGTLGGPSSRAFSINGSGHIVGESRTSNGPRDRATLWNDGVAIDLNSLLNASYVSAGWVLENAYDINDSGSIIGQASNSLLGITSQAFVLTPVPEADTSAMLLTGFGVIGFRARRRKTLKLN